MVTTKNIQNISYFRVHIYKRLTLEIIRYPLCCLTVLILLLSQKSKYILF